MKNSTIIIKKKDLKCGHFDYAFSKGRCARCAKIENTKLRLEKENKSTNNSVTKKPGKIKIDNMVMSGTEFNNLNDWFKDRELEMTGQCKHCGGKTQKGQKNYKCSVAHILPKAYFKSVATHPDNSIELCFYGNSCHTNFDNSTIDIMDLNCFDEIIQKFVKMYPYIAKEEKRRIPSILLEYVKMEL
jgi:hypothetical protein